MTTLVTGATGFIGRHLVDALAAAGDDVRCLTRGAPRADPRANVTNHKADFTRTDLGLTDETLHGVQTVFHLAGATRAVSGREFNEANVSVTKRLLDRLGKLGEKPRFVLISSQAAAGPARDADHPRREKDPEAPIEDYGRSKLAAEKAARACESEMPVTILRPVAVYGPGDRDFLSIFSMIKRGVAIYPGTRHAAINAVFVTDLVAGMIAAARSEVAAGGTYFLGHDAPASWNEIYRVIGDLLGHPNPMEVKVPHGVVALAGSIGDLVGSISGRPSLINSSKAMLAAPRYWLCSSAKAKVDFGFTTPTSLRDGMQVTYDWYLGNRWL